MVVGPGEQQQILGQPDQPVGLLGGLVDRLDERFTAATRPRRELELRAQDRQRGAQLVPGVGDETALPVQGLLQPGEQRVDGGAQRCDLVAGRGDPQPPVEIPVADLRGLRRIRSTGRSAAPARATRRCRPTEPPGAPSNRASQTVRRRRRTRRSGNPTPRRPLHRRASRRSKCRRESPGRPRRGPTRPCPPGTARPAGCAAAAAPRSPPAALPVGCVARSASGVASFSHGRASTTIPACRMKVSLTLFASSSATAASKCRGPPIFDSAIPASSRTRGDGSLSSAAMASAAGTYAGVGRSP